MTTLDASTPARTSDRAGRETFLDAVRVIALIRVVLWHALGLPVLTYFVAAVPTMFFVTGSLLAKSLRRGARKVVVDRARRILVPLWVFTAGAYLAMAIAHLLDGTSKTAIPWRDLPAWIVPITDPHGSPWEGGYLSSPLWYLRALLWLILLSPLLLVAMRRTRGFALLAPATAVFVLEWLARRGTFTGTWAWRTGDLALYATFVMLGFAHRDGRLDVLTRGRWVLVGLGAAAAATWWCATQPVPGGVVNDSHPAHLFVGLAWLSAFFVARPWIERAAAWAPARAFIGGVSQRTITIYLWHSTAVIVSFEMLRRLDLSFPPGGWVAALLLGTAGITSVFVLAFGWVEDLANRRSARVWASTRPAPPRGLRAVPFAVVNLLAIGAFVLIGAADADVFHGRRAEAAAEPAGGTTTTAAPHATLRVPSQAPVVPVFQTTTTRPPAPGNAETAAPTTTVPTGPKPFTPATTKAMTDAISAFLTAQRAPGIEVAVYQAGVNDWSYATGTDPDNRNAPVTTSTRFDIESITKTFTATLVWQAVDQGLIQPDAPIGPLPQVPQFTYTQLTPRQLLTHRTGLVNYRATPEYVKDPNSIDTPEKALAATSRQALRFTPGSQSEYSSSNYLVLGFLLERVTGRSYDDLLRDLLAKNGLSAIPHSPPAPGLPNFSTAGLMPTASELAHWGDALLRLNTPGLSDAAVQAMHAIDPASGLGAGLIGYCPCTKDASGTPVFTAYGHTGGYTWMQYVPADQVTIVVNVTDAIYNDTDRYARTEDLIDTIRDLVHANG